MFYLSAFICLYILQYVALPVTNLPAAKLGWAKPTVAALTWENFVVACVYRPAMGRGKQQGLVCDQSTWVAA